MTVLSFIPCSHCFCFILAQFWEHTPLKLVSKRLGLNTSFLQTVHEENLELNVKTLQITKVYAQRAKVAQARRASATVKRPL